MNESIYLVVAILSCYRIARLVAIDEGPFELFDRLRAAAGTYDLAINGLPKSGLGRLFGCPHCVGAYVALPIAFLAVWVVEATVIEFMLYWFAIAGGQSFLWSLAKATEED